jgi:hypothetical protein
MKAWIALPDRAPDHIREHYQLKFYYHGQWKPEYDH